MSLALQYEADFKDFAGMAVVSDIAANHVETLYRGGAQTFAALTDLLEICQAAVLYDKLVVSPQGRSRSSMLRDLDCVCTPEVRIESEESPARQPARGRRADESAIEVDYDANQGLHSANPYGELLLAMAFGEMLQGDRVVGGLVNIAALGGNPDPGPGCLAKLPYLMVMLQYARGLIKFEDKAARRGFARVFNPTLNRYREYSTHMVRLQHLWGTAVVTSVLEQPLTSCLSVDSCLVGLEKQQGERARLKRHLDKALLAAPGRAKFFEKWRLPPLGLVVLSEARSLDDVPRQIGVARDRFARLRRAVAEIELRRKEAMSDDGLFSVQAEKASRALDSLDSELAEAYAAFDEEISRRRKWWKRTELLFNALDYTVAFVKGLGLGSIGKLVDTLGLKRKVIIQRIPGLLKAASHIRRTDAVLITESVGRLLRTSSQTLTAQAAVLQMSYEHASQYLLTSAGGAPPQMAGLTIVPEGEAKIELTDRLVWNALAQDEKLRQLVLKA